MSSAASIDEIRRQMVERASQQGHTVRTRTDAPQAAPPAAARTSEPQKNAAQRMRERIAQQREIRTVPGRIAPTTTAIAKISSVPAVSNDLLPLATDESGILGMGLDAGLARDFSELVQVGVASAFLAMGQHFWHKTLGGHNIVQLFFMWARGPETQELE